MTCYCSCGRLVEDEQADPGFTPPPSTYAVACRGRKVDQRPRFETWAYPLTVGQSLPVLPIWLTEDLAISLELEASYEVIQHILWRRNPVTPKRLVTECPAHKQTRKLFLSVA